MQQSDGLADGAGAPGAAPVGASMDSPWCGAACRGCCPYCAAARGGGAYCGTGRGGGRAAALLWCWPADITAMAGATNLYVGRRICRAQWHHVSRLRQPPSGQRQGRWCTQRRRGDRGVPSGACGRWAHALPASLQADGRGARLPDPPPPPRAPAGCCSERHRPLLSAVISLAHLA